MEEVKNYELNIIRFPSEDKAKEVLSEMRKIVDTYGFVFVADLYSRTGVSNAMTLEDCSYGWSNLDAVDVVYMMSEDVFIINFPTPLPIPHEMLTKKDMVNHPPHYKSAAGLEVIDVIKAFTSDLTGIEATDTGNIIKYICRWKHKNGVEDLKKARWYINHLIEQVEGKE